MRAGQRAAGRTGRFFSKGREIDAPPSTRDPDVARRLWDASATLTGLDEKATGSALRRATRV